jgi:hypothetical protein
MSSLCTAILTPAIEKVQIMSAVSGFDISGFYKTFSMCVNTTVDSLKEC